MKCSQCSREMMTYMNGRTLTRQHFRSCDADVCSLKCALERCEEIRRFDPHFKSPNFWNYFIETKEMCAKHTIDIQMPILKHSQSKESLIDTSINDNRLTFVNILPMIIEDNFQRQNVFNRFLNIFMTNCSFVITHTLRYCCKLFK